VQDVAQKVADPSSLIEAWEDAQSPEARGADVVDLGKELARVYGAEVVGAMLAASGLSLREIQEKFGFEPASLSNMANGKTKTGPTLWKMYALAEALGYRLELTAVKR
jgi:hypothetical protein